MQHVRGYATKSAQSSLEPFSFQRRDVGAYDVRIDIAFCGICHSDIHQARNEWGGSIYPMVPGHEIVGRVTHVGNQVSRFKVGDHAGVGCFVDSCGTCNYCTKHLEQFCEVHTCSTYNSKEKDLTTPTYGGYSESIVVHENYVLRISPKLALDRTAPLLCAGITTYSPLRQWQVSKGHRLAVLGLGGLGHMAVKLASAMGADVTVLSSSADKEVDATRLGANHFVLTSEAGALKKVQNYFDFIVDTVSAPHDLNAYINCLRPEGTMILLGVPPKPANINTGLLVVKRRRLVGSLIGGIKETQEMLDFCAEKNIMSDIEIVSIHDVNTAYERVLKSDVRYRFVIDLKTLQT